jgi:uncharacterized pyridoxal phosphate-dependent enzyme
MLRNDSEDRRSFLKLLAAAPLFATIGARNLAAAVTSTVGKSATTGKSGWADASTEVYTRLGVRPLINARGTWTYLTGSLELPEVRKACELASHHFVDMSELQRGAGKRLAELSGAEDGMVTDGAAAAIATATAACIAGTDPKNIWQLPDTTGLKSEVVMLGGRISFDSAIRLCGAKLVLCGAVDELSSMLNSNTAMVYTTFHDEARLGSAIKITRAAGVPMLIDDAAGIPPFENITRFAKMGADMFCFSGGKGLCGPQASGLLFGRHDLMEAARANSDPWEGSICRSMKVGKEEIIGVLAALDYWSKADLNALNAEWKSRVERTKKLVDTVPGVTTDINIPTGGNSYPTLNVIWDEAKFGLTVEQCAEQLRAGEPRIEVLTNTNPSLVPVVHEGMPGAGGAQRPPRPNRISIISMTLQPGEDVIVGNRLRQVLNDAREKANA